MEVLQPVFCLTPRLVVKFGVAVVGCSVVLLLAFSFLILQFSEFNISIVALIVQLPHYLIIQLGKVPLLLIEKPKRRG
ncbi:hypothetical protein [Neobacillus ginsengisoli]|uniref:hypothetical protein n=1 Tax=Neobacillus ginsengisoli TaxID=904295 RepID=UPI0027D8A559|nr:hypothetical protein [Neobacillus ginsengisoli]